MPKSNIQVFFNRPKRPFTKQLLIDDIKSATKRLAVASAWFTDRDIAEAIVASPAAKKLIFLNKSDVYRGSRAAATWMVRQIQTQGGKTHVLGSQDFTEGVMHHKFVIVDDDLVWTGSYNLTFHAANNYEAILRIHSSDTAEEFWKETELLSLETDITDGVLMFIEDTEGNVFRCSVCMLVFPLKDAVQEDSNVHCRKCAGQLPNKD